MAGRSPRALRHEALLFSCSTHPSTPALPIPPTLMGCTVGHGAASYRQQRWFREKNGDGGFRLTPSPENAFRISTTTDIHHLPFQEGSMPARRLMTGLAEQTPCLHRLVKKRKRKKKKKSKPWALLKRLYRNPPPEQNSLYITPERRRAGSPGDPASVRKAGVGLTGSSRGEEGPVHIKGSDPGS